MTQKEHVLDLLRRAGRNGMCSLEVYRHGPSFFNARNRVSEMSREGYVIESNPCHHDEKTASHVRWTLKHEPIKEPTQLSLLRTA